MKILEHFQIKQKVKRLSYEILENNFEEPEIILAGINNNGTAFAKILLNELRQITEVKITQTRILLNPADPISQPVEVEMPIAELNDKAIIIVDDVANTGRTIFYATKPLLQILPKRLEVAVLVDRTHKSFPVKVDYVGLSLATTLREHIEVQIETPGEEAVYLR